MQLAHAGRKGSTPPPWDEESKISIENGGWEPLAPSAIPFSDDYPRPRELTLQEIKNISQAFVKAALRAKDAGFKVIEIHAAHGYLMHEFLSSLSNKRNDHYGGSFDNRIRFVLETVRAVRHVWPDELPLFVRISATDWSESADGWNIEDSISLSERLKVENVDLIDVSSGGTLAAPKIPTGPGYQTAFAERIRREVHIATSAVGMITAPAQADHIIRTGQADMVCLAREMLRMPYWPLYAAQELRQKINWPQQYSRAAH